MRHNDPNGRSGPLPVQSVLRALRVLEAVADSQPAGVSELARHVGMPKSNVQRMLLTLEAAGWVRQIADPVRWLLTGRVSRLAGAVDHGIRLIARPVLEELRDELGESVHLLVPEAGRVVVIESFPSPRAVQATQAVGTQVPYHASSAGLVLLAAMAGTEVERLLADGLEAYTPRTITDMGTLRGELERVRQQGWAGTVGNWREDVSSIAAAVRGTADRPIAAITVTAPATRLPARAHADLAPRLCVAAASLSALCRD